MPDNPTIGYSIGLIEGFLESLVADGNAHAATVLEHLRNVEQGYINKSNEVLAYESKIRNIQLNLEGWEKTS